MLAPGPRVTSQARPLRYSGAPQAATRGNRSGTRVASESRGKKAQTHSKVNKFYQVLFARYFLTRAHNSVCLICS